MRPIVPGSKKLIIGIVFALFSWKRPCPKMPIQTVVDLFKFLCCTTMSNLPTYREARRLHLGLSGIKEEREDSCVNGCRLYRKERNGLDLRKAERCPDCGVARDPKIKTTVLGCTNQLLMLELWEAYRAASKGILPNDEQPEEIGHIRDSPRFCQFIKQNPHFLKGRWHLLALLTNGFDHEPFSGYSAGPILLKDVCLFPASVQVKSELFI